MTEATLKKWGNSQGIVIPKNICEAIGAAVGDSFEVLPTDQGGFQATPTRRYHRTARKTAAELFGDWDGDDSLPERERGKGSVGNEIDWGGPVGSEAW